MFENIQVTQERKSLASDAFLPDDCPGNKK